VKHQQPIELLLDLRFDTKGINAFLDKCGYWNSHTERTVTYSPHREVSDIYARYGDISTADVRRNDKAFPMFWYFRDLQQLLEPACDILMNRVNGVELGGVLITKIPPGGKVYRHRDYGWHASTFSKYLICAKADMQQAFCFDGQELRTDDGAVFWFDNSNEHWVTNDSQRERISIICCIRTPQGIHKP
jgi:hypothetical protein